METQIHKPRTIKEVAFCWQEKSVIREIRKMYTNKKKIRTALVIYLSLTNIASDKENQAEFYASRKHIADLSCCSRTTIDRYLSDFVIKGIISKRNYSNKMTHLPNLWCLNSITPTQDYGEGFYKNDDNGVNYNNDNQLEENNIEEKLKRTKGYEMLRKKVLELRSGINKTTPMHSKLEKTSANL